MIRRTLTFRNHPRCRPCRRCNRVCPAVSSDDVAISAIDSHMSAVVEKAGTISAHRCSGGHHRQCCPSDKCISLWSSASAKARFIRLLCWKTLACPSIREAIQIRVEDEVDDAGDGIRSVDRRSTSGQDLHSLEQACRNKVYVRIR